MSTTASQAAEQIRRQLPAGFAPTVGMILGSGLGLLADQIDVVATVDYSEISGFFVSTVAGHAGQMVLGFLGERPVVCMKGRIHLYEGASLSDIRQFVCLLKLLGVNELVITNAAGSLSLDVAPGSVVLVKDHINFTGQNLLVGPNDDSLGPRFLAMENAYDYNWRQQFHRHAAVLGIDLPEGVYIGVLGPSYETPAEINMFRSWGADLIGMSTVHEVIAARYYGMKVAVLSTASNYAAGLTDNVVNHEEVLYYGKQAASNLTKLITSVVADPA